MLTQEVKVKKLNQDAIIPKYQTDGAAGFDLHCVEEVTIAPNSTILIDTGLAFEIPKGYELRIQPRSSLGLKTPLRMPHSIGCVDSDFRDSVKLIIQNTSDVAYTIQKHSRLAQGIISEAKQFNLVEVNDLSETDRGNGGFGSTGS